MRVIAAASLSISFLLIGCSLNSTAPPAAESGLTIRGNIYGGQQPIVGSHIYLFAANTTGYGNASVSLLNPAITGKSDSIGAYVTSGSGGSFTITGDYTCTAGTQVYLYALGGDPGAGVNSAAGLLAALGNCPGTGNFLTTVPFIGINEVSTIAAAYAFAGFAKDATHVSSSGTALAQTGIRNAFANASNLAEISTGTARTITPAGNGTVPQATINTLANILASCINSTGPSSTPCSILLSNARSSGSTGTKPTDTATAAINIAHNPGENIADLCGLQTASPPFLPALSCIGHDGDGDDDDDEDNDTDNSRPANSHPANDDGNSLPTDFNLAVSFSGGGLDSPNSAVAIAIDASGNAWIANRLGDNVVEYSATGAPLSPSTGFTGGGVSGPVAIAVDSSGNIWTANIGNNSISKFSSTGTPISPVNGYTGGGLFQAYGIAIDASGNVWLADGSAVAKFSNSGAPISPAGGYHGAGIDNSVAVAIDVSGNAWFGDNSPLSGISKFSNSGTPIARYTGGGLFFPGPTAVAIDASGNAWAACDSGIAKLSNSGTPISPFTGFRGGGLGDATGLAIDGAGNVWVSNTDTKSVAEWSNSGDTISPSSGYRGGGPVNSTILNSPRAVAIDGSGNVWVASAGNKTVVEFIGAATPVVTPLAAGVKNNTIATRP